MKNHRLELKYCCENHAVLPGYETSLSLAILLAYSALFMNWWVFVVSILFKGNSGIVSLKIFNHTASKKEQNKNPNVIVAIRSIRKNHPLPPLKNTIKIQQVENLIKRTFGKFLAYSSSCAGVICQSSGIKSGNFVQIIFLKRYKIRSEIKATIGNKIKAQLNKWCIFIYKLIIIDIQPAIIIFNNIAIIPDNAITFGLLKKVLNFIYSWIDWMVQLIHAIYLKIPHHTLEKHSYFSPLINWSQQYA